MIKITVIVAVYNGAKTVQRCIDSVHEQIYADKELIIMDGGSTDGTVEILRRNSGKIDFWKSEPDKGLYQAWNKALAHATGDWVLFLGADDYLWEPTVLERAAPWLASAESSGIKIAYGRVKVVREDGSVVKEAGMAPIKNRKTFYYDGGEMPHQGVFHHRTLFERHGLFDESFRISGDYEFLLRAMKKGDALFIPDLFVTAFQLGGLSSNARYQRLRFWERVRAKRKNGVPVLSGSILGMGLRVLVAEAALRLGGAAFANKVANMYRKLFSK